MQQSNLALIKNEIPVGALVYNSKTNRVIAYDHNRELSENDPTAHAEILAIRKSCKILNQKRLDGLSLITNMEPCNLCLEAIKSARIKEVHYFFKNENPKRFNLKEPKLIKHDIQADNLVKHFFKLKRLKM